MKYHLIHKDSINTVLDKARQYRSLLEPDLAISICFDVKARSLLKHSMSRSFAYSEFTEAIKKYEIAEKMPPKLCAEPILRYNSCVRTIEKRTLTIHTRV